VVFPVNNNKLNGEGGSHRSLLINVSDNKYRGFYHHDPIGNASLKHATELMEGLSKFDVHFKTKVTEVVGPRQLNGYDCGVYVLIYAGMLANDITKGIYPKMFNTTPAEVTNCRRKLRQKIALEKGIIEKDKKVNEKEQDKIKKYNKDNNKFKADRVCYKWINLKCWKGKKLYI